MITEMKKAFKLIKYGFQLKINLFAALLITLCGIVMLLASGSIEHMNSSSYALGAFYLILGPMFVLQVQYSLLYSNIVKSSPRAKMLEIRLADVVSAVIALVSYTLIAVYTIIKNILTPGCYLPVYLIGIAILCGVLMLYFAFAYKFFILSVILMTISVIISYVAFAVLVELTKDGFFTLNTAACCVLGYLILLISLVLSGLLRRALYKQPFSKLASGAKLRKEL